MSRGGRRTTASPKSMTVTLPSRSGPQRWRTAAGTDICPSLATKQIGVHTLRHYVNGRVMWPARVFLLVGASRELVAAT